GDPVTSEALRAVLESPGLSALTSLDLSGGASDPVQLTEAVAESPGAAKLRKLRIGSPLTRAEVRVLVESKYLERLAVLDVRLVGRDPTCREMLRRRFGRRARVV